MMTPEQEKEKYGTATPAPEKPAITDYRKPVYTLAMLHAKRRLLAADIEKYLPESQRAKDGVKKLAELDHIIESRSKLPGVRSTLPKKKQRALGLIGAVGAEK